MHFYCFYILIYLKINGHPSMLTLILLMLTIDITKRTLPFTAYDLNYVHHEIEGECSILAVQTLATNSLKKTLTIILSVITLGIPFLLMYWWPSLEKMFFYSYATLQDATHFLIQNYDHQTSIVPKLSDTFFDGEQERKYFYFVNRYLKYLVEDDAVRVLRYRERLRVALAMRGQEKGWSTEQVGKLCKSFGPGAMVIEQPTALQIFVGEIFRPLYIFLMFNLALQIQIEYYYFCVVIGVSAIVGITLTIIEMLRVNSQIHEMSYYQVKLQVLRNGEVQEVSSLEVVPGDIVLFNKTIRMPFQGVLLEGEMLINECVLTGESVPVVKKSEPVSQLVKKQGDFDKSSILYQGTTIVQINSKKRLQVWEKYRLHYGLPVCVTKTNFTTLKGQLIRKILYPNQLQNTFQKESTKFLFFLFFLTVISYAVLTIRLHKYIEVWTLIRRGLDLITITVPPTLPISMTIGIIYAIKKLKNKDIYTISPNQIIEGGLLDTMCFDKTGTLTHDSMDFKSLILSNHQGFSNAIQIANYKKDVTISPQMILGLINMASNHTVVKLQETNQLIGDPMEIELLKFSESEIKSQTHNPQILFLFESRYFKGQVFQRYDFDSTLQRMSVVCRVDQKNTYVFAKGSPQIMLSIMSPASVPKNYNSKLREFASSGFRILAIGSKKLNGDWRSQDRAQLQANLEFNGFQIFENGLKPQTRGAIQQLRRVDINPIMITGDNPITGSNIGYQSGILDPHSKTLIVDFSNQKFVEQEFIYAVQDLQEVNFSRQPFHRQSKSTHQKQSQELTYADKILQKAQVNNYNICLTGSAFHKLFGQIDTEKKIELHPYLKDLLQATQIFSRTKPYDKSNVVAMYQSLGRVVGFCGDGANDCAALNKANLGLSLSDTQASIAAAFTAKKRHIGSMVQLIKQSRAGLATNFSLFNIIACYALTQYSESIIDQFFFSYPADMQFVYQDLFLNAFFVFILGNIDTADQLCKEKPPASLFSFPNIVQLLFFHIVQTAAQILAVVAAGGPFADSLNYYSIGGEDYNYKTYVSKGKGDFMKESAENNITFLVCNFFFLASIIGFTITKPWKKEFYTYWPFMAFFLFSLAYTTMMVVWPPSRFSMLNLTFLKSESYNQFMMFIGLGVGLLLIFIQRCVFVPLFKWIKQSREERQKLERRQKK